MRVAHDAPAFVHGLRRSSVVSAGLFALVASIYFLYLQRFGDTHFYYDSNQYWTLGQAFGRGGHFSLLDFNATIRGYSLPLLNRGLSALASRVGIGSVTIVQGFGSLEIALLGTLLIPGLARKLLPSAAVTPARVLLFNAIVFLFWRDHLGFPLSDFPAITLAVGALTLMTRRTLPAYAIAGFALGLAWNVRPTFLATLLLALILVAARAGIRRAPGLALAALGVMLAGVFVASLPQILINHRHHHSWSPLALSGQKILGDNVFYGMEVQRYETNVGTHYPTPTVFYNDPAMIAILTEHQVTQITSVSQYLDIARQNPTAMVGAYVRHIFNGLDVRYPSVYVHDLRDSPEWFALINYSLLFIAAARLLVQSFRRRLGDVSWPEAAVFAAACIPAIPFAVESRYFLPLQLIVYSLVVFSPGLRRGWAELGPPGRVSLAILYPLFLLACVTLSVTTVSLVGFPSP